MQPVFMQSTIVRYRTSLALGLVALFFVSPVFAMTQCPAEFGEKNPLVNLTGWAVLALALVVGAMLMYYAFTRSRGRPWGVRILVLFAGALGMLAAWCSGLLVALNGFFFRC